MEEVKIGDQIWMGRNLDVATFRNGDPIPDAETDEEWDEAGENGKPAWCYYNYEPSNNYKYGKLYNWHAINDPRGLAPEGWSIPSDEQWTILTDNLGGEEVAGIKMKSSNDWAEEGVGNDESGFSALPGGFRDDLGRFKYSKIGEGGYWWSSTESDSFDAELQALNRHLSYDNNKVFCINASKGNGYSVRCIKEV
jgi:uncharacterized protein (TIGR02145 family)